VLAWVADPEPSARERASRIAPEAATSDQIAPALPDVDGVFVCTPARDHAKHAGDILAAGVDVFVEKPFALSGERAEALVKEARTRDLKLMVGHQLVYHPVFTRLKELVGAGEIGRIRSIETFRTGSVDRGREASLLHCFGPHDVSMITEITLEEPIEVTASPDVRLTEVESLARIDFSMRHESGLVARVSLADTEEERVRRLVVRGARGTLVFDDDAVPGTLRRIDETADGPRRSEVSIDWTEPLELECAHFVRCLKTREDPTTGTAHALRVTRILERAEAALVSSV
jgi:UDP-2-acetamido-3-amino-2,3-dideoxy-glucuronate N-acetyltransferase